MRPSQEKARVGSDLGSGRGNPLTWMRTPVRVHTVYPCLCTRVHVGSVWTPVSVHRARC